ncbi:glycosyltransferase [Adlercreutzia sp. ZJ242]|uniref:glycosyltransferase n=1 Tax=Adlercreutzia sp. ZJ242 TaxID=2709409 RepID=UPI00197D6773|nr:glycosyltransferase [Adlercreutzia sp. ZJ242]
MGGIALFGGMTGSLALAWLLHEAGAAPGLGFPDGVDAGLVALSVAAVFLVGAVDDVMQIRARTKLLGQVVAACVAVLGGVLLTGVHSGYAGFSLELGAWAYPVTALYLVAFANIVNLIDGLDGLAAGVAAISGTALLVLSCRLGIWAAAAMAAALVASCLAFLRFNFHPARLFMGDSGSLTLGFVLGLVSLMGAAEVSSVTSLVAPVVIAAVPVLDTFAAIVRRRRRGVSVGAPDKEHIHHSLLRLGYGQRRVVLTIYAVCVVFAASGVAIAEAPLAARAAVLALDLAIAVALARGLRLFGGAAGREGDGGPRGSAGAAAEEAAPGRGPGPLGDGAALEEEVPEENDGLRMLLMCEHFHPDADACAKRMAAMVDGLRSRGHDVQVLASETSLSEAGDSRKAPEYVHYFPTYEMKSKTVVNRLLNNLSEAVGATAAAKKLGRFDVVVVTSPPLMMSASGISVARRAGARLVFDVRDIWPDVAYEMGSFSEKSIFGRVFSALAKRAYKEAALVTTVSRGKFDKLRKQLPPSDAAKVRLVPNGLDASFLEQRERGDMVEELRLLEDPPVVYVGNLGLAQGLSTLLEIAKSRPKTRFLLFGSGAEEKLLAEAIARGNLSNATLCGRTDARGAFTLLRHARFAYVPLKSSNMTDSVPTKLFEALGCSCPVLLAAQGDSAEILRNSGLGISVPPEDHEGLLRAFDDMLERKWTAAERKLARDYILANHTRQLSAQVMCSILDEEFLPVSNDKEKEQWLT